MALLLSYLLIFLTTLLLTALLETRIIPIFRRSAKQPIYTEGPSWHLKKSGTPTMGGVGFMIPITVVGLFAAASHYTSGRGDESIALLLALAFSLANGLIGVLDDMTKLKRKENGGLKPKEKLFLQAAAVILFLFARKAIGGADESFFILGKSFDLGLAYYPLTAFILLGVINCANLTDGIDGLAASVAFSSSIALFYASYLSQSGVAVITAALLGATVGFLIFNIHPAKIFMGDTGSLFLGALVASSALSVGGPVGMLGYSGIYVIEGFSVVIQVIFFKLTGKRIFKMAPIHHHLEKSGWSENKICVVAILLSLLFSALAGLLTVK